MTLDLCPIPTLQGKPAKEYRKLYSDCKTMVSPAQISVCEKDRTSEGPRGHCSVYLHEWELVSFPLLHLISLCSVLDVLSVFSCSVIIFSFLHRPLTFLNTSVQIFNALLCLNSIFLFVQSGVHFKVRRFQKAVEGTKTSI